MCVGGLSWLSGAVRSNLARAGGTSRQQWLRVGEGGGVPERPTFPACPAADNLSLFYWTFFPLDSTVHPLRVRTRTHHPQKTQRADRLQAPARLRGAEFCLRLWIMQTKEVDEGKGGKKVELRPQKYWLLFVRSLCFSNARRCHRLYGRLCSKS